MSRYTYLAVSLALTLAIVACGGAASASAPSPIEIKDFAAACDKANDGKSIAVTGYLRFPDSFTGDQSVVLRLYEGNDYTGTPIGVQIDFGTKANQVQPVTDPYTDSDLKVNLADGQVAPYGTKVKVSGKVYYPLIDQDFTCALENPLVQLAR